MLSALGKDSTLTGRTYLWETAERDDGGAPAGSAVGADGFWRSEYGAANSIIRYFDYETLREVLVPQLVSRERRGVRLSGLLGDRVHRDPGRSRAAGDQLAPQSQNTINAAFLILAVMVIFRSTTEIDLALEFTADIEPAVHRRSPTSGQARRCRSMTTAGHQRHHPRMEGRRLHRARRSTQR